MRKKNERVELEMQIMKYRQFLLLIADDAVQKELRNEIAALEKKLREIDQ